jgi:hypothetical protein
MRRITGQRPRPDDGQGQADEIDAEMSTRLHAPRLAEGHLDQEGEYGDEREDRAWVEMRVDRVVDG